MTANGAKILGVYDKLGSVEKGKLADLVVLQGDLTADPSVIRKVTTVFKDGVGYDSAEADRGGEGAGRHRLTPSARHFTARRTSSVEAS